jgi:rare lipoprotein A
MTDIQHVLKSRLRRLSTYAGLVGAITVTLSGAHMAHSASSTAPAQTAAPAAKRHWYQIGSASWYGGSFNGRQTASGENYDMTDLTCAHRSLPLGTLVRVTNLVNNKSVVVRVNDRGPYFASRVIDLSYAAAHFLGFSGTTRVRLDVLRGGGGEQVAEVHYPGNGTTQR